MNIEHRSVLDGQPCPTCKGTGEIVFDVDDFDICPNCFGTGLVDGYPVSGEGQMVLL